MTGKKGIKCDYSCFELQLLRFRTCVILGVLTIFVGKPEILVGKSNGSRYSVWEASEHMGCDFRRCNFSTLLRLFS